MRGGKRGEGEGLERKCRLEVWKKFRKAQRKGRFGEQMEVGSVRRVRGMFGACSDLVPD